MNIPPVFCCCFCWFGFSLFSFFLKLFSFVYFISTRNKTKQKKDYISQQNKFFPKQKNSLLLPAQNIQFVFSVLQILVFSYILVLFCYILFLYNFLSFYLFSFFFILDYFNIPCFLFLFFCFFSAVVGFIYYLQSILVCAEN